MKLKFWVFMFIYMFVCSLVTLQGMNQFAPKLACLFFETRKRTKDGQNSGKNVLSSCSSETKHDRRTAHGQNCLFRRADYMNWGHKPENFLGSSLGEDVGFRDIKIIISMIFKDTYQMIRPTVNFRAIKICNKCKHLSNFLAVTLRTLYRYDINADVLCDVVVIQDVCR
jgi:hypothetical protein